MTAVSLKKWGNSVGVRIPSSVLKEAHLETGETLEVSINTDGSILLTPTRIRQEGWLEKFNAIADIDNQEETILLFNEFDEDDWTW